MRGEAGCWPDLGLRAFPIALFMRHRRASRVFIGVNRRSAAANMSFGARAGREEKNNGPPMNAD